MTETEKMRYMFEDIDVSPVTDLLKNYDISGWFKNNDGGNMLRSFQKYFAEECGTKYAFAVSGGSAAIYVALRACGVGVGDQVIVPAYTHVGSVAPIVLAGARPRFVDVDIHGNIPEQVWRHSQAKALIAVHMLGMPCDIDTIRQKYRGYIIEDASHALGSEYKGKRAGSLGDIAAFSIGGGRTKTIGCGEGGVVTTNNADLAERCKNIRNHGDRITDCDYICFNFRMSELNALVAFLQMPKLHERNEWQIRNAEYLMNRLPPFLTVPETPSYAKTVRYIISCKFNQNIAGISRNEFLRQLVANHWDGGVPRKNIGAAWGKLVSDIKFYQKYPKDSLLMSQKLRDNSVWIDWHRYPRTKVEIDELLEHVNAVLKE